MKCNYCNKDIHSNDFFYEHDCFFGAKFCSPYCAKMYDQTHDMATYYGSPSNEIAKEERRAASE